MTDDPRKSIPAWQQKPLSTPQPTETSTPTTSSSATSSHAELFEQARDFLKDETIRSESRDRKVAFLEKKGLEADQIQQLLDEESSASASERDSKQELKTVHDSSTKQIIAKDTQEQTQETTPVKTQPPPVRRDVPPIITYPEFLLKPEKPPPLVTLQRLINAAYILTGASALTYGASKYLVEPMLDTLTEARHDLADKTLTDLETLNGKLESTVSHIPYIASIAALKAQQDHDSDLDSVTSDPTELFHRDIATQTTPQLSRSASSDSLSKQNSMNATNHQVSRLESLQTTLESLVASVDPSSQPFASPSASKKLAESVTQFQSILDKIEYTYNPFRTDYTNIYGPIDDHKKANKGDNNEAMKFKAEIRSLKGAFLSSRNFPTARPMSSANYGAR